MKKLVTTLVFAAAALVCSSAFAETTTFAFSPGGLSLATFLSEAELETISGSTNAITGSVEVDLAAPGGATGSVTFPVTSIRTGIDMRDEHLQGENWLNAAANPDITFALTGVTVADGATLANAAPIDATVTGDLTINGQTHSVSAPASVAYYELDAATREAGAMTGLVNNVLRVEATFPINLSDYGVSVPPPLALKVANELTLEVRLTGIQQ